MSRIIRPEDCLIAFFGSDFMVGLKEGDQECFVHTRPRHHGEKLVSWGTYSLDSDALSSKLQSNIAFRGWYNQNINQLGEIEEAFKYKHPKPVLAPQDPWSKETHA